MAENNRYSRPVAFNRKNSIDEQINKFIGKRNFSGLVKKLFIEKMKSEGIEIVKEPKIRKASRVKGESDAEVKVETAAEKMARMKEQLKKPGN
ncbi:hypothetical protein [Psychrobacillus lasiicapitis]|uniref:Uncharacterized protein n=1 Tax=Psychrobacillus lasiicapitis TaxID=1636719 RepID=A0A544TAK5_9BACI|nr:hypothetical protein [Psychrobacillus lasiicapitis]TQR14416.1 hypothetical protein FG382_08140 [Psychrobacillus lasiicapitis]GGA31528.1 hypothetical protein GCM10011384_21320 [Psychrobacillus lasiicapitis]